LLLESLDEPPGLDEVAPPLDGVFSASELEDEDELDGGVLLEGEELMLDEPDAEPDGLVGVVAPLEDEEPDGELDGLVVVDEEPVAARSLPARSQAVSRLAPSARETATARVDTLMRPPWLGCFGWLSKLRARRLVT
jgi:hypothetical protein